MMHIGADGEGDITALTAASFIRTRQFHQFYVVLETTDAT
jgi:hypothetical protein